MASLELDNRPSYKEYERKMRSLRPPYYGPRRAGPTTPPVALLLRMTQDTRFDRGFKLAFGDSKITTARMIEAMAVYMESLKSTESPYDRHRTGDLKALTDSQKRGLKLFKGKAGYAECHTLTGRMSETLSDGKFHNTGVAYRAVVGRDLGRSNMSFARTDQGSFRTPSLRNVASRPPYMHDGSFATLDDVVRYYNMGGTPNPFLDAGIDRLNLTDPDVSDIVAFLESLTSDVRPGLGEAMSYRPEALSGP